MSPTEIALMLSVRPEVFKEEIHKDSSPAAQSYQLGKLSAIKTAKEQIALQTKAGNPVAIEQYLKNITDMLDDEL